MDKIFIKKIDKNIVTFIGEHDYNLNELIELPNGVKVLIMSATLNGAKGIIINNTDDYISTGTEITPVNSKVLVKFSHNQFGRIINSIGDIVDSDEKLETYEFIEVENETVPLLDRELVNQPLETGIVAIDSMIPVGKGQRQLIIGDRQTGKTSIAVDTVINQAKKGTKCVYVAIGQRTTTTILVRKQFQKAGVEKNVIIINAPSSDTFGMQYLAPYAGMSIANKLANDGEDVIVIFDDLSKHADVYRGISLLLERPPSREAYPGDIFYLHSRLLERAGNFGKRYGSGSVTAFPIIETQANDLTAYIPTNTISITDGQIYTSTDLFALGQLPAIDISVSVSRVGSSAQRKLIKKLSSTLKIDYSRYYEVKKISQISGADTPENKLIIQKGDFITKILMQENNEPVTVSALAFMLKLIMTKNTQWFKMSAGDIFWMKKFLNYFFENHPTGLEIQNGIIKGEITNDNFMSEVVKLLKPYLISLSKVLKTIPEMSGEKDDIFVNKFLKVVNYYE